MTYPKEIQKKLNKALTLNLRFLLLNEKSRHEQYWKNVCNYSRNEITACNQMQNSLEFHLNGGLLLEAKVGEWDPMFEKKLKDSGVIFKKFNEFVKERAW